MENTPDFLHSFHSSVRDAIQHAWNVDEKEYTQSLVREVEKIGKEAISLCDQAEAWEEDPDGLNEFDAYWVQFEWIEKAKSFLLLWRNVIFEEQRAEILLTDNSVEKTDLETLREQSKQTLEAAERDMADAYALSRDSIEKQRGGIERQLENWKLQFSALVTYREQILALIEMCKSMGEKGLALIKVADVMVAIRMLLRDTIQVVHVEIDERSQWINGTLEFVEEGGKNHSKNKILTHLEQLEERLEFIPHNSIFTDQLDEKIEILPNERQRVPVAAADGVIYFKEVHFPRSIRYWLESEILPLLYEIWEQAEQLSNRMKMALANIKNRVMLLPETAEENAEDFQNICQPFTVLLEQNADLEAELKNLENLIEQRLGRDFKVRQIYHHKSEFLPVRLQSTIKQFRLSQNSWLNTLHTWWQSKWTVVQNFLNLVEAEESLSISEKIVRYVQHRLPHPDHSQYANIFLTQGYIGESFWVGRQQKIQQLETQIDHWRNGFRGAAIITGQRFSGKSLMGELILNRHFSNKAVRLVPKTSIIVQGRRFEVGYKLADALDFIQKHSLHEKQIVWIDDLELWRDSSTTLGENARALMRFIDNYSSRIFFLVGIHNWPREYLQQYYQFEDAFQSIIQLDQMADAEIREAILIRHGATHKALVDEQGREVRPKYFTKNAQAVSRLADGNIGDALYLWTINTKRKNSDEIIFEPIPTYHIPENLSTEMSLMLSTILLEKRTNEYSLRKRFGPAFKTKYTEGLKRLIGLGLLNRGIDGWLEISPVAVNEINRILKKKNFIK